MCGIAGIFGPNTNREQLEAIVAKQQHRGPDATGAYIDPDGDAALGHNRLSIIDLSPAGNQPMFSADGNLVIVFNGEIYNYLELRSELSGYPYRSQTDTEVVLAAYQRWGASCLDRFIGMFAFLIWDIREKRLFAARDRFGVKPLYYHQGRDGTLSTASEIQALHAAGIPAEKDAVTWATYLATGAYDHSERTFWKDISSLPGGCYLSWHKGELRIDRWYDLAERSGRELDQRPAKVVQEEYLALLADSVRLRFRSDVPVGINLSGGLDSSTLLGVVQQLQGPESTVNAYTFVTGDARYDELPWVEQMLAQTRHPLVVCWLKPEEVPSLAESVQAHQDGPFGGLPTLAYARLFEQARADGTIVLLDGHGMDEQWAGYDYYGAALNGGEAVNGSEAVPSRGRESVPALDSLVTESVPPRGSAWVPTLDSLVTESVPPRGSRWVPTLDSLVTESVPPRGSDMSLPPCGSGCVSQQLIQGTQTSAVRPDCLTPEFLQLAEPFTPVAQFADKLRNLQYRDARYTKIPRALRFNDRISMRASTELREPFLDHRLFELALRQPAERKILNGTRKLLLRQITSRLLPRGVVEAPKRPLQTPQREWLRGPLQSWANDCIEVAISVHGNEWLNAERVRGAWQEYCAGSSDNSFYVWQWVNLGIASAQPKSQVGEGARQAS